MVPSLPFGPLSLPTGPIFALMAVVLALDVAGRYGRRLRIHPDDIWNTGLLAIAAGLIVARLWNVFQFWPIYREEVLLIFSLRPSGFEFWPGAVTAFIAGYAYLLWRALNPVQMAAALAVGMVIGGVLLEISGHLTGAILGLPSPLPWATNYFGMTVHPVGLYRAAGLIALTLYLWIGSNTHHPERTVLVAVLGYSLIRLIADGFLAEAQLIGPFRVSQVIALLAALSAAWGLARSPVPVPAAETAATHADSTQANATQGAEQNDPAS
jgi:phosphatidylglycerol---prolipoprotein diacylglyceryl transferase